VNRIHVCRFDSADHLVGKRRTYEAVKAAVLEAGRFSIFEATKNQANAAMFTQLTRDPEVETDNTRGYPWIYVKAKVKA
jgi:hypothetical protein